MMIDIHYNQPLKELNSFGLDARAGYYFRPVNAEALTHLLEHEDYSRIPRLVLGEGSNILFRNNFDGLIIHPCMKGIELLEDLGNEVLVEVGAAENWDSWVAYATGQGWHGLENLSLIPGSVGSSPVQNIGAYGVELKDRFEWLDAWDLEHNQKVRMDKDTCQFAYRSSIFKGEGRGKYLILQVVFRLSRKPDLTLDYGNVRTEFNREKGNTPLDLRKVIISIRRSKLPDPAQYGNAGSFFKNPLVDRTIFKCLQVEYPEIPFYPDSDNQVKIPAAWLIEKSGWKGKRLGNVGTWPKQPLVLVNYGGATGQEIYDFSERILEDVEHNFGISLQREVHVI